MKNKKIIICGGYGYRNWGDEAQLLNNVRLLKEKGYKDLTILSPNSYIQNLCKCPVLLLKNLTSLKKYDILFFSGSGTINTRNWSRAKKALKPCELAIKENKKIILSGQGITPLNNPKIEKYIAKILNQVDTIVIRDFELGKKELKRIGIKEDKIILGIDDAFTTPAKPGKPLPKNSVGINISCYVIPRLYTVFYEVAKQLKEQGFNPIFNFYQSCDEKIVKKITKNKFPIKSFNHPYEIAEFNKQIVASIGMRYHSTVFSLGAKKPNVNIYLDDYQKLKLKAINDIFKVPSYLNGNKCNAKDILKEFHKARQEQKWYNSLYDKWIPNSNLGVKKI